MQMMSPVKTAGVFKDIPSFPPRCSLDSGLLISKTQSLSTCLCVCLSVCVCMCMCEIEIVFPLNTSQACFYVLGLKYQCEAGMST